MRLSSGALGLLVFLTASCNFDAAFKRYCEGNPSCPRADAGVGPETAPDAPPDARPDTPPDAPPDARPDTPPDAPPDAPPDTSTGPDTSMGLPDSGRDLLGDGLPPLPPPLPRSCRQDNDCWPNELCHPLGNVCMQTCSTVADCPLYLDTCAEITDQGGALLGTRKVCQCQIADNCASYARSSNFTCNPYDNLCERMCRGNQDCQIFDPPRVCIQGSGWCQRASGSCSSNRDCPPSQPRCDLLSLRCAGCVAASDCANRPDGLTQCSSIGACVPP